MSHTTRKQGETISGLWIHSAHPGHQADPLAAGASADFDV
jgi:hypothetical protein